VEFPQFGIISDRETGTLMYWHGSPPCSYFGCSVRFGYFSEGGPKH